MTHLVQRSVLILLAGTALTACASPGYPIHAPLVQIPPPAAPAQPPPQVAAVTRDVLPDVPQPTAPVESRPLADLSPQPAARTASVAMDDVESAQVLAIAPPAVDAAARAKSSRSSDSYTVRRGDTLAEVADRMGSDIETLAKINGLKKPYRLDVGQVIKGPRAEKAPAKPSSKSKSRSETAAGETYEVRRGDTLFAIALRLGTTVEALQAANGLGRGSAIMPGRKLVVPGSGAAAEPAVDETPTPEPRSRKARPAREEAPVETGGGGREVTGRVVNVETPGKAYKVKKGDTLERVARRLDSEIDDLARINKLKKPYRLQPGQTIRGPGDTAKAYVVGRGDTLAEIAQRFGVTVDKLRAANGLRRGAAVAPGRKLRLPAGYRDRGPIASPAPEPETREPVRREPELRPEPETGRAPEPRREPTPRPRSSFDTPPPVGQVLPPPRSATPPGALPSRPQPYTPSNRPPSRPAQTYTPQGGVNGAPTASPPVSEAQIMEMGRGLFIWPIRGDLLSGFGQKSMGQSNDGLNIRASTGDPVRSAADGDVVYAGDQVPGFGNLVLVKHANGWVTAYGHLSRVAVRMQQKISQGQEIGQAGSSGGVSEPQLHFEVRYAPSPQERARPVDPALVLPR